MDHVVYVDAKAQELEKLMTSEKTMIIRGAAGRKLPYGRVNIGDTLYLVRNNAEGSVLAKCHVINVFNSDKMTPDQSNKLVQQNQAKLQLTALQLKRWSGKRYLVLIEVAQVEEITPFAIDKSNYGNMDDWLPVENISNVKK